MLKRFLLALFFSFGSIVVVQGVLGAFYAMLSRPFDGSLAAGIAYNIVLGALSLALCQFLLVLTADRRLASTATRWVAGFYFGVLSMGVGASVFSHLAEGTSLAHAMDYLPATANAIPWIVAALFAHKRMVFDWTQPQQDESTRDVSGTF